LAMWHGDGHAFTPFDLLHDDVLLSRGSAFRPLPGAASGHRELPLQRWHGAGPAVTLPPQHGHHRRRRHVQRL